MVVVVLRLRVDGERPLRDVPHPPAAPLAVRGPQVGVAEPVGGRAWRRLLIAVLGQPAVADAAAAAVGGPVPGEGGVAVAAAAAVVDGRHAPRRLHGALQECSVQF